jgi:hypothetical protein
MATQKEFVAKVVLMVGVAIDELTMVEAEADLAKTRIAISSVKATWPAPGSVDTRLS